MKYSEFEKKVKELGFEIERGVYDNLNVVNNSGKVIIRVYTDSICQIDNATTGFDELDLEAKKDIFKLAVELASTPLEEREDEKKFFLKMNGIGSNSSFVNLYCGELKNSEYIMDDMLEKSYCTAIFTDKDILKMPENIQKAIELGIITKIEVTEVK